MTLSIGALATATYVAFATLAPNDRSRSNIPSLQLSDIEPNSVFLIGGGPSRTVIVRNGADHIVVLHAGVVYNSGDAEYVLWGTGVHRVSIHCDRLLYEQSVIRCESDAARTLEWNTDGSVTGGEPSWQPEQQIIPHEIDRGVIRYGRGV
ncbi:MAG: hypothetical protein AAFN07_14555 [Pseudomonadota bacterium]